MVEKLEETVTKALGDKVLIEWKVEEAKWEKEIVESNHAPTMKIPYKFQQDAVIGKWCLCLLSEWTELTGVFGSREHGDTEGGFLEDGESERRQGQKCRPSLCDTRWDIT